MDRVLPTKRDDSYKPSKKMGEVKHEFENWDYLKVPGVIPEGHKLMSQGSRYTKFGPGFYRRPQGSIKQDNRGTYVEKECEHVDSSNAESRLDKIIKKDNVRGYNIITGEMYPGSVIPSKPHRKYLGGNISESLKREGEIAVRDTASHRFHMPWNGIPKRIDMLSREGLLEPKTSSILGIGRADVVSRGVVDSLSRADYLKYENKNKNIPEVKFSGPKKSMSTSMEAKEVANLP